VVQEQPGAWRGRVGPASHQEGLPEEEKEVSLGLVVVIKTLTESTYDRTGP